MPKTHNNKPIHSIRPATKADMAGKRDDPADHSVVTYVPGGPTAVVANDDIDDGADPSTSNKAAP